MKDLDNYITNLVESKLTDASVKNLPTKELGFILKKIKYRNFFTFNPFNFNIYYLGTTLFTSAFIGGVILYNSNQDKNLPIKNEVINIQQQVIPSKNLQEQTKSLNIETVEKQKEIKTNIKTPPKSELNNQIESKKIEQLPLQNSEKESVVEKIKENSISNKNKVYIYTQDTIVKTDTIKNTLKKRKGKWRY